MAHNLTKSLTELCLTIYCLYLQFYTAQRGCLTWKLLLCTAPTI